MAFADSTLTCGSCGLRFLDSAQAQRERNRLGESLPPRLCPGCLALDRLTSRHRGTVRWFDRRKGYGFIRDEQGLDVFVHRSSLGLPIGVRLRPGAEVEFDVREDERGPTALRVALAG